MGVSLAEYGIRIGLFRTSNSTSKTHGLNFAGLSFKHVPLAALIALLLISGIEPNPGLEYTCKVCQTTPFKTTAGYFKHGLMHRSDKHFSVRCPVSKCTSKVTSLDSLYSHLSRYHAPVSLPSAHAESAVFIKCPVCEEGFKSLIEYKSHMRDELKKKITFKCGYNGCNYLVRSAALFSSHMSRYHGSQDESYRVAADPSCGESLEPENASTSTVGDADAGREAFPDYDDDDCGGDHHADDHDGDTDCYPPYAVKDEVAKFYLKLESFFSLATSTVQSIAEEVKLFTDMSHHCLKKALRENLESLNLPVETIETVVGRTFNKDPIFNIHHKYQDVEQLETHHLRCKYWRKRFPFVDPKQVYLGKSEVGKPKYAHHISVAEALEVLLRDDRIKEAVVKSFNRPQSQIQPDILEDFTDGSAFRDHLINCHGHSNAKCIQLLFFQDAFDPSAFAANSGSWKTVGFYWVLGNLPAKYRSRVDLIQMAYLVLEKYFTNSVEEEVKCTNKWEDVLTCLLKELAKLKAEGVVINGERIPVCVLFFLGDNLGQHQIGGFVRNFSSTKYFCRFCVITRPAFLDKPYEGGKLRTKASYNAAAKKAKELWGALLQDSLKAQARARELQERRDHSGEQSREQRRNLDRPVSVSAFQKLKAMHVNGVKYHPSPLNSEELQFHVADNGLPPCLAHDFFEGILKTVLPKILKHFSEKGCFDLAGLNRRITSFSYKGTDARDTPKPLKSFDALRGSACEIWTLTRLLPCLIGELVNKEDPFWKLFLYLKEITEYVCAPKIRITQLLYLRVLIGNYLSLLKDLLPSCLTPKHHFLWHYPDLILIFGPLIRVFTLRFESKHKYFKDVIRQCKNYINLTSTLSKNYTCRFAYDHSSGSILADDLSYVDGSAFNWKSAGIPLHIRSAFSNDFPCTGIDSVKQAALNGTVYKKGDFVVLDQRDLADLEVGCIYQVLVDGSSDSLHLLLERKAAINTFDGLYKIMSSSSIPTYVLVSVDNLPDYYPLPSYNFRGYEVISLKHSSVLESSV